PLHNAISSDVVHSFDGSLLSFFLAFEARFEGFLALTSDISSTGESSSTVDDIQNLRIESE
ncbi:hypothetical protein Tco_0342309, partial [Tanacetum coccineum]